MKNLTTSWIVGIVSSSIEFAGVELVQTKDVPSVLV
jgi:hypothetical protein